MKSKLAFSTILVIAVMFYLFSGIDFKPEAEKTAKIILTPPPTANTDKFLVGTMESYLEPNLTHYVEAGLNTTHVYITGTPPDPNNPYADPVRHTPATNPSVIANDYLKSPVPSSAINTVLQNVYSHNQSKILWMRPKIEWLAYGKSSTYQAEDVSLDDDYWFYSFQLHDGESIPDYQFNNGNIVLHVSEPNMQGLSPRDVLKRLKANDEQQVTVSGDEHANYWQGDNESTWIIKPRIRISQSFVTPEHDETPICSVKVLGHFQNETTVLKETIIKAKYFRDKNPPYNYDGSYIENFNFSDPGINLTFSGVWGDWGVYSARGTDQGDDWHNKADIQVYWYDNCEMWIDYVKVQDNIASDLLSDDPNNPNWLQDIAWIDSEVDAAMQVPDAIYNFYIELPNFNNIPCIGYLNKRIQQRSGGRFGLMGEMVANFNLKQGWQDRGKIVTPEKMKRMFTDSTNSNCIFLGDPYPIAGNVKQGCPAGQLVPFSEIPETLPIHNGNDIMGTSSIPSDYDAWFQATLDTFCVFYQGNQNDVFDPNMWGQRLGVFEYELKHGSGVSKLSNKPLITMLQAHQWLTMQPNNTPGEVDREPTIEEENLMSNLAVSYGVKGIVYWWMKSFIGDCNYSKGILDEYWQTRNNVYGQDKWTNFKNMVDRLNLWGPTLMSFDNTSTNSYIYRYVNERNELLNNSYFRDVVSYKRGSQTLYCVEDDPGGDSPEGFTYECKKDRFLQVSTFQKSPVDGNQYFMIVNKCCSPIQNDHNDGERLINVSFDAYSPSFIKYNSWKIVNIAINKTVVSFDKRQSQLISLGLFGPGEGRLYRIEPVIPTGGHLVADETINGNETILDTIWNNGFSLIIANNVSIQFADTAIIIMNGGNFMVGNLNYQGSPNINFNASGNGSFHGLYFQCCNVSVYNTNFGNLSSDTSYALNLISCANVDIRNNNFIFSNQSLNGAISITYIDNGLNPNVYIGGNTFSSDISTLPQINVMSYAGSTIPIIIENNNFTSSQASGSYGILMSGINGAAVKTNTFSNFDRAISCLSSSLDVAGNTISSSVGSSKSIEALAGSEVRLTRASGYFLGGLNNINNTGNESDNIYLENSWFLLDFGENVFNVNDQNTDYHLKGSFPLFYFLGFDERKNCFNLNNTPIDPIKNITWGTTSDTVSFNFIPFLQNCTPSGGSGDVVINLGGGVNDTILMYSGSGGSFPSPSGRIGGVSLKQLYDSICVQMRYRNYNYVKARCIDMITNNPDSIQSLNAISKLYLATSATDTTSAGLTALKTFYENLILNNGSNTSLL